jgi:hypothetical protein
MKKLLFCAAVVSGFSFVFGAGQLLQSPLPEEFANKLAIARTDAKEVYSTLVAGGEDTKSQEAAARWKKTVVDPLGEISNSENASDKIMGVLAEISDFTLKQPTQDECRNLCQKCWDDVWNFLSSNSGEETAKKAGAFFQTQLQLQPS